MLQSKLGSELGVGTKPTHTNRYLGYDSKKRGVALILNLLRIIHYFNQATHCFMKYSAYPWTSIFPQLIYLFLPMIGKNEFQRDIQVFFLKSKHLEEEGGKIRVP